MQETLIEKIKKEGGYQDIEVNGKKIFQGWRSCDERWDIIKKVLTDNANIIDIGSHYGFFSIKASQEFEDVSVWSFEEGKERAEIQREALKLNNSSNVYLSEKSFSLADLNRLLNVTEVVDFVFMLSVLHYFPKDEIRQIIEGLSQLTPNLIIEIPTSDEQEVAGDQEIRDTKVLTYLKEYFDDVIELGSAEAPKHIGRRIIYHCKKNYIKRDKQFGYITGDHGRLHEIVYDDGYWQIDGKAILIKGFNAFNLFYNSIRYPDVDRLFSTCGLAYKNLIDERDGNVTDISLRNCIIDQGEAYIIDFSENIGEKIYDMEWEEYHTKVKSFTTNDVILCLKNQALKLLS